MTATWLGLWAAAESARERGDAGSAELASPLAEFDRLLDAAAQRPLDQSTVRDRALLALCTAERTRVEGTVSSWTWVRAVEALDALGAVPQRAYARVRLAEALLSEGGDRSAAAESLNRAVDLLAGAPRSPIRALAEQAARRARLRLAQRDHEASKPDRQDHFGLTEREADVLSLLAEARTNREIGETLFISPKTVSVHVSNLMRKLGVTRRAEASRLAKKAVLEQERDGTV
jgi:DNA-binding NarL/FixJ family response regulator